MENLASAYWMHISLVICVLLMLKAKCLDVCSINENKQINITYLEIALSKGAVCLDGSPPAYHFDKGSDDGINNWIIYLEGGGWCENASECYKRVHMDIGSSFYMNKTTKFEGILSETEIANPDFFSWNRVFVRYCDGSSFSGDVEQVDPATNLHYRGRRVFKAVIDDLLHKGMMNATNAILAGSSAGGLATILNCDDFRAMVPNAKRVKCISDAGYFIHAKDSPGLKKREDRFAGVVSLHKLDKFLPKSCTSKRNPGLCLFPEYLVNNIQTPLFLLNSLFDSWQIQNSLDPCPGDEHGWENCTHHLNLCSSSQLENIKNFGVEFVKSLPQLDNDSSRGLFINSCYRHGRNLLFTPRWNGVPTLANKTIAEAIGEWYFERSPFQVIDTIPDVPKNCPVCPQAPAMRLTALNV